MVAKGLRWMELQRNGKMEACGNASVTYFGCGDGYIKLHMIKLH